MLPISNVVLAVVCTLFATLCQTTGNGVLAGWLKAREDASSYHGFFRSWLAFTLAIAFLAGHFFTWYWVVSWASVSFVVPFTAVGYLYNALLARAMFGEHISRRRWTGILCIMAGILVVWYTGGDL